MASEIKIALVLALAVGLFGGALAQERHQDEAQVQRHGNASGDYQIGYKEGLRIGQYDRDNHRIYEPGSNQAYKDGNQLYRQGFLSGYDDGFGREQTGTRVYWGLEREHRSWDGVSYPDPFYRSGYDEGVTLGRSDRSHHHPYQPENYKAYKEGNQAYRSGFTAGYDEGFGPHP